MSPWEKQVAEAAISVGSVPTHPQLESDICVKTGMKAMEVKSILNRLVEEGYIFLRGGPSQNRAEDPNMPSPPPAKLWYEKGRDWELSPRFAQHADAGPWHYETRLVSGVWEWEIFEMPREKIASGTAPTLEQAKAAIITETGRAPDEWKDIGPEIKPQEETPKG